MSWHGVLNISQVVLSSDHDRVYSFSSSMGTSDSLVIVAGVYLALQIL